MDNPTFCKEMYTDAKNSAVIKPYSIGKKQLTRIIKDLQTIRRASTLQMASFSNICRTGNSQVTFEDGRQVLENNVTDFIRERVRIYNETWITGHLEEIISELALSINGSN